MSEAAASEGKRPKKAKERLGLGGVVRAVRDFLRESVAELRRVVWPTKQQVSTYTAVVMTFVVIMAALIFFIDYFAGQGVLLIFGN